MAEKPLMSFAQLSTTATFLNKTTDELTETVGELDSAIRPLNIGLTVWVQVAKFSDEEGRFYDRIELGWSKVGGGWGISIRKLTGDDEGPDPDEVREVWPFNDAPRELRLCAVEKLPELVDELGKAATKTAQTVSKKLAEARALTAAMGIPAKGVVPKGTK